ncbi:MAG: PDZ domain-containing protein [Myxococcales bacterium]|nr:PDZ domain-containing protein [Myxococcales bacterium]
MRSCALVLLVAACASTPPRTVAPRPPSAPAAAPDRVPFGPEERAAELIEMRDALRDVYAHLETKQDQWGISLHEMFERYEPKIRAADTWPKYEAVMVGFISELHDGHIQWRRKRATTEARRRIVRLGLDTVFVGDELIVSNVWPGAATERAGLAVGDKIVAIDGDAVADRARELAAIRSWSQADTARYDFAAAWPASRVRADTTPRARVIARERADGTKDTLSIVPETTPRPGVRPPAVELQWRGDVAILGVHTLKERVAETRKLATAAAAQIFAKPNGLVVDLRDNDGGYEDGARAIVAQLVTGHVVGTRTRVRLSAQARAQQRAWRDLAEDPKNPGWSELMPVAVDGVAPRAYAGKIAVIIDAGCMSSCETLALLLRASGARIFGSRTAGSGGAPVSITFARSGARLSIPARAAFDLGGEPIEGRGVTPDEPIAATRADIIARRDAVLERAIDWVTH